jgi:hypothetical protein
MAERERDAYTTPTTSQENYNVSHVSEYLLCFVGSAEAVFRSEDPPELVDVIVR